MWFLKTLKALSIKLVITGMGFQSARIGALCGWNRSLACGFGVLFAGLGFFCGTAGAMAIEIG